MFDNREFATRFETSSIATTVFEFLRRILQVDTLDALLESFSEFPFNKGCESIFLRQCIVDEEGLPRLEPEAFWIKDGSQTEPWTTTIHVDDESLAKLWILSGGPPMFIESIADFALFTDASRAFHQEQGIVSLYHILLKRQAKFIAVLSVMWCEPRTFPSEYQATIEFTGWVLALVVENIYLHKVSDQFSRTLKELEQKLGEAEITLHALAHDLKQPISVIITSANLLDSYIDRLSKEQITEKVQRITRTGFRMSDWITSILLLAQVRGTATIELQTFDIKLALDNAIVAMQSLLAQTSATTRYDVRFEDLPPVLGHITWVEHIWANFISNACKYGGSPPEITIGAEILEDAVRFTIRDNGLGIPAEKLHLIFEPFTRLTTQGEQRSGTGIGLTTVKLLIQKLGGDVGVQCNTDGCAFWFTLRKSDESET
jgi:signal transduction histidine kinase